MILAVGLDSVDMGSFFLQFRSINHLKCNRLQLATVMVLSVISVIDIILQLYTKESLRKCSTV